MRLNYVNIIIIGNYYRDISYYSIFIKVKCGKFINHCRLNLQIHILISLMENKKTNFEN